MDCLVVGFWVVGVLMSFCCLLLYDWCFWLLWYYVGLHGFEFPGDISLYRLTWYVL